MNFLGMGPLELLLILALALVVFGPAKLPEIGSQIGRAVRDLRRTTSELNEEFTRNLRLELEERRIQPQGAEGASQGAGTADGAEQPGLQGSRRSAQLADGADSDLQPPY